MEDYPDLIVAVQRQDGPDHWSFFLASEEDPTGTVFQVLGDPEHMYYNTREGVNMLGSASFRTFVSIKNNINPEHMNFFKQVVVSEPPPRAESYSSTNPNCQDWTLAVVKKLETAGVARQDAYGELLVMKGKRM